MVKKSIVVCLALMMSLVFCSVPTYAASLGKPVIKCAVSENTVTVKWSKVKNAKKYRIQVKDCDLGKGYKTAKTVKAGEKAFSMKIRLSYDTQYAVRVVAVAKNGKSKYSSGKKIQIAECDHEWKEEIVTPGSCQVKQKTVRRCLKCGKKETKYEYLPHDYELKEKKPTCLKNGSTSYVCKVCGKQDTTRGEFLPKLGHNKDDITVYEPTPERPGYTVKKCSNPGCDSTTYCDSVPYIPTDLDEETMRAKLENLKEQYPDGYPWGPDTHSVFTSKYPSVCIPPYGDNGPHVQRGACSGFALLVQEELFGQLSLCKSVKIPVDELRIGDEVVTVTGSNTHVEVVIDIDDDGKFYTVGGNVGGKVYWGGTYMYDTYIWNLEHPKETNAVIFYSRYPDKTGITGFTPEE